MYTETCSQGEFYVFGKVDSGNFIDTSVAAGGQSSDSFWVEIHVLISHEEKKLFIISFRSPSDSDDNTCNVPSILDPDNSEDIEILIFNGGSDVDGQFACLLPQGTNDTNYFGTDDIDGETLLSTTNEVEEEFCRRNTPSPTPSPTPIPTSDPAPMRTNDPTPSPSPRPTSRPTDSPSPQPIQMPIDKPTPRPTPMPSDSHP